MTVINHTIDSIFADDFPVSSSSSLILVGSTPFTTQKVNLRHRKDLYPTFSRIPSRSRTPEKDRRAQMRVMLPKLKVRFLFFITQDPPSFLSNY